MQNEINKLADIKAVIFDMDGVIADTEPLHIEAYRIFFKKFNLVAEDSLFHSFVGVSIEDSITDVVKNRLKEDVSTVPKRIKERNSIYIDLVKSGALKAMDGFYDLINNLKSKGITIALASSSPREQINVITDTLNIRNYFSVICSGHDVENTKPAPDIYLKTINELNIAKRSIIAIEDSIAGVTAAKAAGIRCIALENPYMNIDKLREISDISVKSLKELIPFI